MCVLHSAPAGMAQRTGEESSEGHVPCMSAWTGRPRPGAGGLGGPGASCPFAVPSWRLQRGSFLSPAWNLQRGSLLSPAWHPQRGSFLSAAWRLQRGSFWLARHLPCQPRIPKASLLPGVGRHRVTFYDSALETHRITSTTFHSPESSL